MDGLREFLLLPLVQAALGVVALLLMIAMGAYLALWSRKWATGSGDILAASEDSLILDEYREAYEAGRMSKAEFERVRSRLGESLVRQVDARTSEAGPFDAKTARPSPIKGLPLDVRQRIATGSPAAGTTTQHTPEQQSGSNESPPGDSAPVETRPSETERSSGEERLSTGFDQASPDGPDEGSDGTRSDL